MKYFVSYYFSSVDQNGFGSIEMTLKKPIKKYKDVKYMLEYLNSNVKDNYNNSCKCIILNYLPLEG